MYNRDNYKEIQPRQSCITSFQVLYGIGRIKATRLNSFLLNHPVQTRFVTHFEDIMYPVGDFNMWSKIPLFAKIKLCVKARLQLKSEINCYSMYRLFQNLPTRGQRTRANGNSIKNYNPYLHLDVNMDYYQSLAIAYKQRELTNNERYDELKAYTEAQALKEKMHKEDKKVKNKKVRQDFIKNKKNK